MVKLTPRQLKILELIRAKGSAGNQEIKALLDGISRATVVRDVKKLAREGVLEQRGQGRSVRYAERAINDGLRYVDIDRYFQQGPDERAVKHASFNFGAFNEIKDIFTAAELRWLKELNGEYRKKMKRLSAALLRKEWERMAIEFSWKSSQIEGNTYSLIDTEILLREQKEAAGHKKEEAVMILNHKRALDYILSTKTNFKKLTVFKIGNLHDLIVSGLGIERRLRRRPVGIVGTRYRPLDNEHQIREAMDSAARLINKAGDPFTKAVQAILLISYIQPFEDGNKRTARLLGNAVLLAHQVCPLSFRSVNEADYKKAMIVFYEQNNARPFKDLFVEQFMFAVKNYF